MRGGSPSSVHGLTHVEEGDADDAKAHNGEVGGEHKASRSRGHLEQEVLRMWVNAGTLTG